MTLAELARALNGIEYSATIHMRGSDLMNQAKASGLVVVYGASDDLMEFDGAFHDEIDCYNGGEAYVDAAGLLPDRESIEDDSELQNYFIRKPGAKMIEALWDQEGYSWIYKTDIPHKTFDILEDGEKYCRGIVFALADLVPAEHTGADPGAKPTPSWQLRVIEEKAALDSKLAKLDTFIAGPGLWKLHLEDAKLLQDQANHMRCYSLTLEKRIARFGGEA